MIKNEREYRITKAHLAGFEGSLIANDEREFPANVDPGMKKLMHDAITSEIEVLRAQIDHYEKLRDGHITSREITSLHELPIALIEARIAATLTQHQLAERVGVAEQQVQRWEANDYAGVGVNRLQQIADALGMQIHETITYSNRLVAERSARRGQGDLLDALAELPEPIPGPPSEAVLDELRSERR